jgi:predicted RNase H-like HicB family nuclease
MKKRYDRGEISKLLKASATSKNHGRSLEEAIRMSQEAQDNMMESMHGHHALEENVALAGEPESHAVEARPQSVGTESSQETKASK